MQRKIITLVIDFECKSYFFNSFLGTTFSREKYNHNQTIITEKIKESLVFIQNPYLCKIDTHYSSNLKKNYFHIFFGLALTIFSRRVFFAGLFFSKIGYRKFNYTSDAISYYRKYIHPNEQDNLCMPRTLFAAATSKSFRKNGILYIGVFLPSNSLHAWIIEDGMVVDKSDKIWIHYQPLAMIYYE